MSGFCHLHLHSEYSLLEGACRLKDIPDAVIAAGQTAVAITDREVMFGCAEFWRLCTGKKVKPIIGCQLPVILSGDGSQALPRSLVLLCENEEGYRNLSYISAHFTRIRGVRAADEGLLKEHSAGLIALSGGREGEIFAALSSGDADRASAVAAELVSIFGRDNFFIELEDHADPTERQLLPELVSLAERLGIGTVATNDVHYLRPEDEPLQSALACIREGRTLDSGPGLPTGEFWLKTAEEMERILGGYHEAIANTGRIADRCNLEIGFGRTLLPTFPLPQGVTSSSRLRELALAGFSKKRSAGMIPYAGHTEAEYTARAEKELSVIGGMGLDDYFLIVADYVGYAKRTGIPVGPGRGSACGSLVAYLLEITGIDPVVYGLYFERFLNPERRGMPDIDIDFDYNRRDEMISYVRKKYGAERVSQIAAFGTLAARAAVRDAARVSGLTASEADALCSLLPKDGDLSIADAASVPAVKEACRSPKIAQVIKLAGMLEGLPRNLSVHPAGVVISDRPLWEYLPLIENGDSCVTQYDMNTVSDLGLLKFDFLALRNLSVINEAEKLIREKKPDFSSEELDLTDRAAYAMISSGSTEGIFQLESEGLRRIVRQMRPASIDDLTAAIALFRPGPMDSIPAYIEGRRDPSKVRYLHPILEPILRPTYGCIIYQEQVMNIFVTVAGYSLGRADLVRKAMSKKKASVLEAEREGFVEGAKTNGLSAEEAGRLFDGMSSFAAYAFNKSHAVAYAVLTFRTAYLKAHYPGEFMTALMNSVIGSPEKLALYASEAEKLGVSVAKPDVNRSGGLFSYCNGEILFGLSAVRGVGYRLAEDIAAARGKGYSTLGGFLSALSDRTAARRPAEALIRSGALDSLGIPRSVLLAVLDEELERRFGRGGEGIAGQLDIFSAASAEETERTGYPQIPEFTAEAMAAMEKDLTGVVFTGRRAGKKSPDTHAVIPKGKAEDAVSSRSAPGDAAASPAVSPAAVYLRVPSSGCAEAEKARNLAAIFEGSTPFFIYSADDKQYRPAGRIDASGYLIGELEKLAGKENLAVRSAAAKSAKAPG